MRFFLPDGDQLPPEISCELKKRNVREFEDLANANKRLAFYSQMQGVEVLTVTLSQPDGCEQSASLRIDLGQKPPDIQTLYITSRDARLPVEVKFADTEERVRIENVSLARVRLPDISGLCRSVEYSVLVVAECDMLGEDMPSAVWQESLAVLCVRKTLCRYLPAGIERSPYLRHLELRDTELRELPDEISEMGLLQTLDCDGNLLADIPPMPATFRAGSFKHNRVRQIPDWVHGRGLHVNINANPIEQSGYQAEAQEGDFHVMLHGRELETSAGLDFSRNLIRQVPPWLNGKLLADFIDSRYMRTEASQVLPIA